MIVPAFGTELSTLQQIKERGCQIVDTTCGDVMSVWKRVRQYSQAKRSPALFTAKREHEETKATSSRALGDGSGHYLVVFTLAETDYVCDYILQRRQQGRSFSRSSKAPIRLGSIRTCICRRLAWRTRPRCCAAKPRKCNAAFERRWST